MLSAAEHPLHDSYTQPHAIEPLFLVPGEHGRAWQAQAWHHSERQQLSEYVRDPSAPSRDLQNGRCLTWSRLESVDTRRCVCRRSAGLQMTYDDILHDCFLDSQLMCFNPQTSATHSHTLSFAETAVPKNVSTHCSQTAKRQRRHIRQESKPQKQGRRWVATTSPPPAALRTPSASGIHEGGSEHCKILQVL